MLSSVDEVAVPRGYILDQPEWDNNVRLFYKRIENFKIKLIDSVRDFVDQIDRGEPLEFEVLDKTMRSFIWYAKRLSYARASFDEKHFHRPLDVS